MDLGKASAARGPQRPHTAGVVAAPEPSARLPRTPLTSEVATATQHLAGRRDPFPVTRDGPFQGQGS
jgi:hypothetical protein